MRDRKGATFQQVPNEFGGFNLETKNLGHVSRLLVTFIPAQDGVWRYRG